MPICRFLVKPGTDGALACAVMHCLFRDGKADWAYLEKYTDVLRVSSKPIYVRVVRIGPLRSTGAPIETIEQFAKLIGAEQARFFQPRLWVCAFAQWRGEHARGQLHSGRYRCLAV